MGGGVAGWVFDIVIGLFTANVLVGIPLAILGYFTGNPGYLVAAIWVLAGVFGVRFMRRARSETGPVWSRHAR